MHTSYEFCSVAGIHFYAFDVKTEEHQARLSSMLFVFQLMLKPISHNFVLKHEKLWSQTMVLNSYIYHN